MKVAIYVRVSSVMQVERGHSLESQKKILIEYCKKHNYEYEIFEDKGISAKNTNREKLQELLSRLYEFNIVLVWKLSRLTRSVSDFASLIESFKKNNVTFISYSEKFNTKGIVGKLLMFIIAIFAELERDILAENIALAKKQCYLEGLHTCVLVLRIRYN